MPNEMSECNGKQRTVCVCVCVCKKTKSNTAARLNSVSKDLEFLEMYTKIASQAASQPSTLLKGERTTINTLTTAAAPTTNDHFIFLYFVHKTKTTTKKHSLIRHSFAGPIRDQVINIRTQQIPQPFAFAVSSSLSIDLLQIFRFVPQA